VPRVIRAFRDGAPNIALTLEEGGTIELIEDLRHERVDAAFIRTHVTDPAGLTVNPLLEEAMLLALPSTHSIAASSGDGPPLPLAALAAKTFVVYRRHSGPGLYDAIIAACHARRVQPAD
jgi:DNA-binding transcriptional LysR family regulator